MAMIDASPGRLARLKRRWNGLPGNLRGAAWMVLGSLLFSQQGAIVKTLGAELDVFQIAFFRCAVGFLAVVPFVIGHRAAPVLTGRLWLHLARAVVGVAGMFCGFYSVTHLPLAEATAISFTKPLFLILLAVFFLGEPVRWRRWLATVVGFIGILIVVRPGGDAFGLAALVGLLGSFLIADVAVLAKKLSATERTATILFYFGAVTTLVSLVPAAFVWRTPTAGALVLLVLVGLLAVAGQACTLRAYRAGETTAVAPFDSARLLFAIGYGYFLFADVPDWWSLLGAMILIASTIYIANREARLARAPAPPTAEV
ncbi:MAG: DMT family transporter [Rhodospirillales bacterium]|nr:DMT family transporter [Rhodospirillales bacterium]